MKLTFGEFLKQKRIEKGLTQKSLSEMLFVSESTVSKWEKDVAHPDMSMLTELSEILGVTEHELISASVDETARKNTVQAKKWRNLTFSWNLFFYISYGTALLTCFIVNLAVEKRLSWFFIVLSSLLLSATFTTFPQYIKKYRIIFIPLTELVALILLFLVCNLYTGGGWFYLATLPTVTGVVMVFLPIIIAKSNMPTGIKKYNGYISVAVDFVLLSVMLLYISVKTDTNFFVRLALPLCLIALIFVVIDIFVLRLKINPFIKHGISVALWDAVYISAGYGISPFLSSVGIDMSESTRFAPFSLDFSKWTGEYISNNVCFIIFATMLVCAITLFSVGIIHLKKNKKS